MKLSDITQCPEKSRIPPRWHWALIRGLFVFAPLHISRHLNGKLDRKVIAATDI